jgi:hypothetical protein
VTAPAEPWVCPRTYAHPEHPYWQQGEDHWCEGTPGYHAAVRAAREFHERFEELRTSGKPGLYYRVPSEQARPWRDMPETYRTVVATVCAEMIGRTAREVAAQAAGKAEQP